MEKFISLLAFCTLFFNVQNSMIEGYENLPEIDAWWGPKGEQANQDTSIRPFKVRFEDEMVEDLRYRLKNHRPFTPPLEGSNFTYGFNTNNMENWVNYWADSYNFTEREAHFNKFPHYKTNIQGLDIHFIWIKQENVPAGVQVIPMMMLHGWPGSIMEFYKAIPLLTAASEDRDYVVELIVPSLPGFGFSQGAVRKGMGGSEIAVVLRNLMHRIGHQKFYLQGGDWGSHICKLIATLFPNEVLGYHTNYAISYSPAPYAMWIMGSINEAFQSLVVEPQVADRLYPFLNFFKGSLLGNGYMHLQATKPDTIGVAMSDSPSGLLAYVLQIVSSATRSDYTNREDGGLYEKYTQDELIDDLMVYWVNNAFTTAIRIYSETYNVRNIEMGVLAIPTNVPLWLLQGKSELRYQSPKMLQFKYTNILNTTVLDTGGHFFALELPEIFSDNVLTALTAFRQYWSNKIGCVKKIEPLNPKTIARPIIDFACKHFPLDSHLKKN